MDEKSSRPFQVFSAPYLANTEQLISAAEGAEHCVFYRTGSDSFRGAAQDFFSAGSFTLHEVPWAGVSGQFNWQGMGDKLATLDHTCGPLAGYISYEAGFAFEPEKWGALPQPDTGFAWRFLQMPCWYEADHAAKTARICAMHDADISSVGFLKDVVDKCVKPPIRHVQSPRGKVKLSSVGDLGEISQMDYEKAVSEILEDIREGRYYELNLTQRFRTQSPVSPAEVFMDIFSTLSPRCGFFCNFQDQAIVSGSPEMFLKKTDNRISTRPVKGSISGPVSELEMQKLAAEHVMVVDLARNDLGRVANLGWVSVDELQVLGQFGGLTHLESLISGSTSMCWQDILSHTFPAASITGMPKVIVVQSIAQYEKSCRGVYTGACGWVSPDGDFDFNVGIRTLTALPKGESWQYELGAGGAIVADSIPQAEYQECLRKAQPLISAL